MKPMRSIGALGVTLLSAAISTQAQQANLSPSGFTLPQAQSVTADTKGPSSLYIVELDLPPVVRYDGALPGLFAPALRGDGSVDPTSPAARDYANYLEQVQSESIDAVSSLVGRRAAIQHRYAYTFSGYSVELSREEAARVASLDGVKRVTVSKTEWPDTDAGPAWIGAPQVWDGSATGISAQGEGIVVGIIDSGINHDHPSFAAMGGDGYTHTNPLGSGTFLGYCDTVDPTFCNDKLIGAYDFVAALSSSPNELDSPEDENSHGSHVASTAAGNFTDVTFAGLPVGISGVAPHANIIAYDVCADDVGCPNAATVAAIDQVVADGIASVINYSIGRTDGNNDPYGDPPSIAFLNATAAGVFVAASAGNSGPGPATLGHNEPWVTSVANMTHNRLFANNVSITGPMPVPGEVTSIPSIQGTGPELTADVTGEIVYAGDVDGANFEGCAAFPADSFLGSIALISRGSCSFADKLTNATDAGATAVIVFNNRSGAAIVMGNLETSTIPSVMIRQTDGDAIVDFLGSASEAATAQIDLATSQNLAQPGDSMTESSARGPNEEVDVLKPDVGTPGQRVLAAVSSLIGLDEPEVGLLTGTSMSSPHTAGSAALLKQLNPSWSPMQIKSALMMTAKNTDVFLSDETTPAGPFDRGNGRVQVPLAAQTTLVMDESAGNFAAADPASPTVDAKDLNLPSYQNSACFPSCTFTRTVRNATSGVQSYTLSGTSDSGLSFSFNPASFTLGTGLSRDVEVTIDSSLANVGVWNFAEITFDNASGTDAHFSAAVLPIAQTADAASEFAKAAPAQVGPLESFTYQIDVSNIVFDGMDTLTVSDTLPAGVTFVDSSESEMVMNGMTSSPLSYDMGTNTVSWEGTLDTPSLQMTEMASPFGGFVDLPGLGVEAAGCSTVCDDTSITFTGLPEFEYLGQTYTTLQVSSNGFAVPGGTDNAFSSAPTDLPDSSTPNNILAPFWTDLDLDGTNPDDTGGGNIFVATLTCGGPQCGIFVQWDEAEVFGDPAAVHTFQLQIVLPAFGGGVFYSYDTLSADADEIVSVGAENATGTIGATAYTVLPMATPTGTRPTPGTDLQVVQSAGGTATLSFDVVADAINGSVTNTATISDGVTTLEASATTVIADAFDSLFATGFEGN